MQAQFDITPIQNLVGQKATIWASGDMGFGWAAKCVILKVEIGKWAQHDNVVMITYKPMRKKNAFRLHICGRKEVVVWAGHHDVNTDIFSKQENVKPGDFVESKALSCSSFWRKQAVDSVAVKPVFDVMR